MTTTDNDDDETRTPPESPTAIAQAFYARSGIDIPEEHVDELAAAIHRYGDMRARETEAETVAAAGEVYAEELLATPSAAVNLRPSIWSLVSPAILGLVGFVAGWLVWG